MTSNTVLKSKLGTLNDVVSPAKHKWIKIQPTAPPISIIVSDNHNRNFTVIADSRSALHAIETPKTTHSIISFIQSWIIRLASRRKIIQFCWVPSHMNISGNEHADREAKAAAATDQAAEVLNTRVPHSDLYGAIKSKTRKNGNIGGRALMESQEELINCDKSKILCSHGALH